MDMCEMSHDLPHPWHDLPQMLEGYGMKVLPCPFCGSERARAWVDDNWRVFCPDCNCCTQWSRDKFALVKLWNTRSGAPASACPFCGGQPRLQVSKYNDKNRVICRDCGCSTAWSDGGINASWRTWNSRKDIKEEKE